MAKGKTSNTNNNTSEYNQKLQAILLTDTYTKEFYPFFYDKASTTATNIDSESEKDSNNELIQPRSLIPLNHIPLISYTLDVLSTIPNIEEIYIFLSNNMQLQNYIKEQYQNVNDKSKNKYPHLKFHCIVEPHVYNVGDALREIDRRNVIRSDPFILVTSGFVSNISLGNVIEEHIERKKKDSSAILTLVLRKNKKEDDVYKNELLIGLDEKNNNRVLVYDRIDKLSDTATTTTIPCSFFASHSCTTLRKDLRDVGLYICSPDVLARFSDAFDCQNFRNDFIKNIVSEEEEALQNKIYAHVLPQNMYAHFVEDWRTYSEIGHDLLYRWCDFVNMRGSGSGGMDRKYQMCSYFVYKEIGNDSADSRKTKKLDRSAIIKNGCMIGLHSSIGTNSRVENTVIGRNCDIKSNVKIAKSHIWDNVQIEDNVHITHSIISDNVIIKSGACISKGCVIGKGSIIGTNVTLPEYTRIVAFDVTTIEKGLLSNDDGWSSSSDEDDDTSEEDEEEIDDDDWSNDKNDNKQLQQQSFQSDSVIVGVDGLGQQWKPTYLSDDDSSDDDDDDDNNVFKKQEKNEIALQRMYSQSIGYDPKPMYQKYVKKLSYDTFTTFQDDEYVTDEDEEHRHDDTNNDLIGLDHTASNTTQTTSNNPSYTQSQQDHNNNMSSLLDKDGLLIQGRQKGVNIIKELREICIDHDSSNGSHNADHLMIELNGYKFSQNATFSDVVIAVIHAIFQRMDNNCTTAAAMNPVKLLSLFTSELSSWGQVVLQKLCYSLEEEKHIIYTLEQIAISSISNSKNDTVNTEINDNDIDCNDSSNSTKNALWKEPTFRLLLQKMHDLDILSEESILEWASERKTQQEQNSFSMDGDDGCIKRDITTTTDHNKMIYQLFNQQTTQDFLSWLEEESDDDDGSSSDGDDSEED